MASIAFGTIGGIIGKQAIGSAIGASLGQAAFGGLGSIVDGALFDRETFSFSEGKKLTEVNFQHSSYGQMIPIIYGEMKISGNVIWASPLQELSKTTSQVMGGKGGKIKHSHTSYDYMISLAIALCEGPISKVRRIWADGRLLDKSLYEVEIYKGDEEQIPDRTIEGYLGIGKASAYRGIAYVVFRNLHLIEFGNRIPNFSFEVIKELKNNLLITAENLITGVTLIPGAGEFVYDTEIQQKIEGDESENGFIQRGYRQYINNHTVHSKANVVIALDDMQESLPNLKWVAPVVSWFATSENLNSCIISPGVENQDLIRTTPKEWQVAGKTRYDAHCIGRNDGKPRYGGTPADSSVINMLHDLRKRGLKVMLYPMVFIDASHKPWRGRLTGTSEEVQKFFNKENGYNQFIRHYAELSKGLVDAFIIGSELIGLTKVMNEDKAFPAVDELIKLAKEVKVILGEEVIVTYAADWSEYHHTDGGWYNLDPLWACDAIDVVGIDAYFPLTDGSTNKDLITKAIAGWDSGEGYDFYYKDEARNKRASLSPAYAIKNITWWWENYHYNPDGTLTDWRPKGKKIWFTEYGFPSVDGATNQPNVFYNPESSESSFPRGSNGKVDFAAQRAGIIATELRWRDSIMVDNKFVWTWDARPYPEWPDYLDVWADGGCWLRGHWLQGKLGISELGQVIADLCCRAGLDAKQYKTSDLTNNVHGLMINKHVSCKEILTWLRSAFVFDVIEEGGTIKFDISRGKVKAVISKEQMLSLGNQGALIMQRPQTKILPSEIILNYICKHNNYQISNVRAKHSNYKQRMKMKLDFPMILEREQAQCIADNLLNMLWVEGHTYCFFLSVKYYNLMPGDVIEITDNERHHKVKINKITFGRNKAIYVEAVRYYQPIISNYSEGLLVNTSLKITHVPESKLEILDIRVLPYERDYNRGRVLLAAVGLSFGWKGAIVFANFYGEKKVVAEFDAPCTMGSCITRLLPSRGNIIDRKSRVVVNLMEGILTSATDEEFAAGKNLALIGNEIVQFQNAILLKERQYELSYFVRGKYGSEYDQYSNQRFVLLDSSVQDVEVPHDMIGSELEFSFLSKGHSIDKMQKLSISYEAKCLQPLTPVHIRSYIMGKELVIKWIRRSRANMVWRNGVDIPLAEEEEMYIVNLYNEKLLIVSYRCDQPLIKVDLDLLSQVLNKVQVSQVSSIAGIGMASEVIISSNRISS